MTHERPGAMLCPGRSLLPSSTAGRAARCGLWSRWAWGRWCWPFGHLGGAHVVARAETGGVGGAREQRGRAM